MSRLFEAVRTRRGMFPSPRGWFSFLNGLTIAGFVIVGFWIFVAIFADFLTSGSPLEGGDLLHERLLSPSAQHWFGTDDQARDVYTRVVYGARGTLLLLGMIGSMAFPLGMLVGIVAAMAGRMTGGVLLRIVDVFFAFPRFMMALPLGFLLGGGPVGVCVAVAATLWPPYARMAYQETRALRGAEHVQYALLQKAGLLWIMRRHVLPLCAVPVLIRMTLDMGTVVVMLGGLSFLGLGVSPPFPEWGMMIAAGRLDTLEFWWVTTMPAIGIMTLSLGFTVLGDGLGAWLGTRRQV